MVVCLALSGLGASRLDLISSPCRAPTFFELRGWCAWTRSSLAASCERYRTGGPWSFGGAWRSPPRTSRAGRADDQYRTTSPGRFVDPSGGNDAGDPCVMARVPPSIGSVDVRPHGHPRRRAGAPGTRTVVGRRSPLWMEEHPDSRLIDSATPLKPL